MSDSKHVAHFQQGHQRKNEKVIAWAPCSIHQKTSGLPRGVLIVTSERVSFCRKAWFGGEHVESIELRNVTSVERSASMGTSSVVLRASSNAISCIFNWASKEQVRAVFDALDEARSEKTAAAS